MKKGQAWSAAEIAELRTLAKNKTWTAEIIASKHSRKMTRNAVIGACTRFGIKLPRKSNRKPGGGRPKNTVVTTPVPAQVIRNLSLRIKPKPLVVETTSLPVSATQKAIENRVEAARLKAREILEAPEMSEGIPIDEISDTTCKWMISRDRYCGVKKLADGKPYCDYHKKVAHEPAKGRGTFNGKPTHLRSAFSLRG